MFKGGDIGLDVQELTESIENMTGRSLNYWLCKFVQEVANKSCGRDETRCYLLQINLLMSHDFSRISGHLDIVSKSLKIWINIQIF